MFLINSVVADVDKTQIGIAAGDEWEFEVLECTRPWDCDPMDLNKGDIYTYKVISDPDEEGNYTRELVQPNGDIVESTALLTWFMAEAVYTDWDYWENDGAIDILDWFYMKSGEITIDNTDDELFIANYTISDDSHVHFMSDPVKTGFLHLTLELKYFKDSGVRDYHYLYIESSDPFYPNGTTEFENITLEISTNGILGYELPAILFALIAITPLIIKKRK